MFNFQTLKVWQKAIIFCDKVLNFADVIPSKEQFSLAEQLRRAVISIPTNIAEGSGRRSQKEAAQFYNIARGSCAETINLLVIAAKRDYLAKRDFQKFYSEAEEIVKMLYPLMSYQKEKLNSRFSNLESIKGQGMVEMVVAIAVILTGVIGALALTVSNLSGVGESSTRIVASNLAREGIEVVRNIRDTNWLKKQIWDNGLEDGNDYTAIAIFNPVTNTWNLNFLPDSINDIEARLYRNNGIYLQDISLPPGTPTIYYRLLSLDEICKNNVTSVEVVRASGDSCLASETKVGIRIKSEVKWTESGRAHTMTAEDRIYNWR